MTNVVVKCYCAICSKSKNESVHLLLDTYLVRL